MYVPFSIDIESEDFLTNCLKFASHSVLGPVSRKPWKLFGPVKPCLGYLYLKNGEVLSPETYCMKATSVHHTTVNGNFFRVGNIQVCLSLP